ncbi:polysaccharide biosynthesis/export family protein [Sphingobacterium paludis]|uniref:Polysaccharide export outer membrane protein n=1 Tax=Sphingobacterium paludis TaxID=1476465 RepID=A0A4R7CYP6_9SPHI|nr:polysaccharide biosynthesis/export family protein [Sphingobacterium paludis]TDS13719.1 polysaccharide export outer membrane protein [Sphingobacterium paludis]
MKNNPDTRKYSTLWYGFIALFFLNSCAVKNIPYFQDLPVDSARITKQAAAFTEPVIQFDDILSVTIQTIDPTTAAVANQAINESAANGTSIQQITGFLVDKNGSIQIPMIGSVQVAGLTTYQARERILEQARQFYKEPTVHVRFANYKITVLGEVARPAAYTVPNEKVSVLDAIGLAGDLTIYGKRENVLLIRDKSGEKELVRLNLNDSKLFQSPYFYLKQNDVIYVEPGKARSEMNNASRTQTFALITSLATIITLVLTRFF